MLEFVLDGVSVVAALIAALCWFKASRVHVPAPAGTKGKGALLGGWLIGCLRGGCSASGEITGADWVRADQCGMSFQRPFASKVVSGTDEIPSDRAQCPLSIGSGERLVWTEYEAPGTAVSTSEGRKPRLSALVT